MGGICFDIDCPGCGVHLNEDNVGGYQCYCIKCVEAMPELPSDGRGYQLVGEYPKFEWFPSQ